MAHWKAFPHTDDYAFTAATLKAQWEKLHAGDREPVPKAAKALSAWVHFHNGQFEKAAEVGLKAGAQGISVANKATCIYAVYLEPTEKTRLRLLMEVAHRAAAQMLEQPENPNAYYWQGYALGRYSQGISVAKALAQGIGGKVKSAFETAIRLEPLHADAHIGLGSFHAEIIDKVGALIGNMTYGAKKETSLRLFQQGLALTPKSTMARLEYANALVILEGDKRMTEATHLYERVAATKAIDALERLDVEMAQAELAE
jgi:tetratricopeptide (TPR) repeat protein